MKNREIFMYRMGLIIGGIATPLTGFVFIQGNSSEFDSWGIRIILGCLCMVVVMLTFASDIIKRNLDLCFYGLLFVFQSWTNYLFYKSHFAPVYLSGIFLSVLFSVFLSYRRIAQIFLFLVFSMSCTLLFSWIVVSPQTAPSVVATMYFILTLVIGISQWTKFNIQKKLEESEASLFTVFNESTDAIYLVKPLSLDIIDANEQGVKLSASKNKSEIIGNSIKDLFAPIDPYLIGKWIPEDVDMSGLWSGQQSLRSRDGQLRWIDIAMQAMSVSGKRVLAVRLSDVTKIKSAEQELASKAQQLAWINQELTRVNQTMTTREKRMVELMQEAEELKKQHGASLDHASTGHL